MKILNLYAGIGGNRKLWGDEHEIVAVESEEYIADVYRQFYPNDTVIVADAHQYLVEHFKEFDFIWSSPPCPSHSRVSTSLGGWGLYRYPDMKLYEEILFLKHFYKGKYVVENVVPYYRPLINPTRELDRHLFWTNFPMHNYHNERNFEGSYTDLAPGRLMEYHDIYLPKEAKNKRKLLRNAVHPKLGLHVFTQAFNTQGVLL